MSFRGNIICVPPALVAELWPIIGPQLLRGLMAGGDDLEVVENGFRDALEGVFDNTHQVWIITEDGPPRIRATFGTRIFIDEQHRKVLEVSALGGEGIKEWGVPATQRMVEFGRAEGCDVLLGYGRPALARVYENMKIVGNTRNLAILERAL